MLDPAAGPPRRVLADWHRAGSGGPPGGGWGGESAVAEKPLWTPRSGCPPSLDHPLPPPWPGPAV